MKRPFAPMLIIGYFVAFIFFVLIFGHFWKLEDKTPEQPINFSHQIHTTKVGLKCTHCHQTVEKSRFAGIPPVQTCMNCHKVVKKDRPEIKKLKQYWDERQPIPWQRVTVIPVRKYVYFSHKRHVKAGLDCSNCHGEVRVMPVIKRVSRIEMGWCVSCHRANNAPTDCATCHK